MECLGNSNKWFSTFRHLTEKLDHTLFDFCKQTANSKQKNHFGYFKTSVICVKDQRKYLSYIPSSHPKLFGSGSQQTKFL